MGLKKLLSNVKSAVGRVVADKGPDGFPMDPKSSHFVPHCHINDFLIEVPDFTEDYSIKPAKFATGRAILEAAPEVKISFIEAMAERRAWVHKEHPHSFETSYGILWKLTGLLHRCNPPYTSLQAAKLVRTVSGMVSGTHWFDDDIPHVLRICERLKVQTQLSPELRKELIHLKDKLRPGSQWESAARARYRDAIDRLTTAQPAPPIDPGEAWTNVALEDLKEMPERQSEAWLAVFEHCRLATAPRPTQKWTRNAEQLIAGIGRDKFKASMLHWLDAAPLPRPVHAEPRSRWDPEPDLLYTDRNSLVLKGLVWCCAGWKDAEISRALSALAEACFKKVRMLGPRSPRVGNACLYSLGSTASQDAAAQLNRLDQTVKQPTAKKFIDKSLDKAAELTGKSREELEECTVPDYGLDADGRLAQTFGKASAELRVSDAAEIEVRWKNVDGNARDSVPAEVKSGHEVELKKFRRMAKEIEGMISAHRVRLERLLLAEREWSLKDWRARYLDHRLLSHLTRRLIWHFEHKGNRGEGIWRDGKLVDAKNRPLDWLGPETRVRLWHPLGCQVEVVAAWRQWLVENEISQPFKQAHREIYVLTDAERKTETYSNRFAAHILAQHQFAALAKQRGWKYSLMGNFDSHNTPTLQLPRWKLSVEFWLNPGGVNDETTEIGIYTHVATDQVRFIGPEQNDVPLEEVPALVFSEAMRDVDLFVGVCSIGNHPEWRDAGDRAQFGRYWQEYSFGDLSATAMTRYEVLERLLPRLRISGQCSLTNKFLVVQGSLRTYKIHLGSANILMEPNNQYLCIVPKPLGEIPGKVMLPFEGDRILSVILSKAFLLAEDVKIKDQSILKQIRPSHPGR